MYETLDTGTGEQFRAPTIGAKTLRSMARSLYPLNEDTSPKAVRFSISLNPDQHADLTLVAELWNEFDRILGKERVGKWKLNSVVERMVSVGLAQFWAEIGGRPPEQAKREEFIRAAVERISKGNAKK